MIHNRCRNRRNYRNPVVHIDFVRVYLLRQNPLMIGRTAVRLGVGVGTVD